MSKSPVIAELHAIEDIAAEMVTMLRLAGFPTAASAFATSITTKLHAARLADDSVRAEVQRLMKG